MRPLFPPTPLLPHPASAESLLSGIEVAGWQDGSDWVLQYALMGELARLAWPDSSSPGRFADALWQSLCLEWFVAPGDPAQGYREFNLALNGDWAIYDFSSTRQRAAVRPDLPPPTLNVERVVDRARCTVRVPAAAQVVDVCKMAVSVVVATVSGQRAYWALAHPAPVPDFHRPEAFVLDVKGGA